MPGFFVEGLDPESASSRVKTIQVMMEHFAAQHTHEGAAPSEMEIVGRFSEPFRALFKSQLDADAELVASVPAATSLSKLIQAAYESLSAYEWELAAMLRVVAPDKVVHPGATWAATQKPVAFEPTAHVVVELMATHVEAVYKSQLRSALFLTWLLDRRDVFVDGNYRKPPGTVGALRVECDRYWKDGRPDLLGLLSRDLVLLRNSKAHSSVEVDPRAQVVWFVDARAGRESKHYSLEELGICALALQGLTSAMAGVFNRQQLEFQLEMLELYEDAATS